MDRRNMSEQLCDIKKQWQKLIADEPVETGRVRPDILTSWKYCHARGIDPYGPVTRSQNVQELLERSHELVAAAKPFMDMINEIISGSGLRIDCIDHQGFFLCSCGDSKLLNESELNGMVTGCDVGLETLGTNAAGLSLHLRQPVQVFGPEHYNVHLHNLNCSATPIYAPGEKLVGALNILSYATPQNRQTLGLTTSIALAIENQLALTRTVKSLGSSNARLKSIMEYLPQGVISVNGAGEIEQYNTRALEMLSIPVKDNLKRRLNRIKDLLASLPWTEDGRLKPEPEYKLQVNSHKKNFLVDAIVAENDDGKLVLIEDSGRIMSLSAVQASRTSYTFDDITGQCEPIKQARKLASIVAATDSSVLLVGESGTGKELFAQAIHAASKRSRYPFVAINCGAIPADIIESELFGYEAGAFTGAREAGKPGRLETASGGTLFLDEVEAMPLSFQVKLLRAFSSRSIVRVGGVEEIPIDLRIVSASKVDLLEEINQRRFREDFYYRIATFPIQIPALHERGGDIRLLTCQFLRQVSAEYGIETCRADDSFFAALEAYRWRGNVRELRNSIERAVLMGGGEPMLTSKDLPEQMSDLLLTKTVQGEVEKQLRAGKERDGSILRIAEEAAISMILKEEQGNIARTSRRLGVARSTLYQKIRASHSLSCVVKSYNLVKV